MSEGDQLWTPSSEAIEKSNLSAYMTWLQDNLDLTFTDYDSLWTWSVNEPGAFWESIWRYFDIQSHSDYTEPLASQKMPGAQWFPGATLNYTEHALRRRDDHLAVIYYTEDGQRTEITYAQLADRVARARAGLKRLGVARGDRVASFMPNCPETLIAFLATASVGAIWSSCSPEFGVGAVLDRFQQIEPKVLFAIDGYPYNGKRFDRREAVGKIRAGLRSLDHVVWVRRGDGEGNGEDVEWPDLLSEEGPLEFDAVPFDHPLWVLYSSGTTGLPKPIVHGHGGILLELFKTLSLHSDFNQNDRFFWVTTTGWMMWNYLISGLLIGTTIVLYDGSPGYPDLNVLWKLAEDTKMTYFGTSAPFLLTNRKNGIEPGRDFDLSRLRGVGSTGAPLPAEGFEWVYEHVSKDVLLGSVSGGTDVCTAFILSCPILPVHSGEIQCRGLGCKVEAFNAEGQPVYDEVGELVITAPMPSMPIYFWNDEDGRRYRESYFAKYEGVWRHGDWIKITSARKSCVVYGRSDSTLNRGGVRMGTSEFYRVVDTLEGIADSLVVDTGSLGKEGELWLFVVLATGATLDDDLRARLKKTLRETISPRHVPDHIHQIPEVPRTLSGKKLEVPIKKVLEGAEIDSALNRDTLKNPESIDAFLEFRN